MRAALLLHKLIGKSCKNIDKRITRTLFEAAESLAKGRKLSIAEIGRSLSRNIFVKHSIKCIDRLFGNAILQRKKEIYYLAIIKAVIKPMQRPLIVVDWSGLTHCGKYHFLRAALIHNGRTITLYEQSYEIKFYGNSKVHKKFLHVLKRLLPNNCRPIVITDAGFRNNWFILVVSLGWDYVGRIRNLTQYKPLFSGNWCPVKDLYIYATCKPKYLGNFLLAKTNPLSCHFHLIKQRKKYRTKRNLAGKKIQCSVSLKHAKGGNEPWLIATSLDASIFSPKEIINIYKRRMQIEEGFRDLKNTRNGLGLRVCRSTGIARLNIALLIGTLTGFILWVIGLTAKRKNIHYTFQSNTEKKRNVLSNYIIGWQALERRFRFTITELISSLQEALTC